MSLIVDNETDKKYIKINSESFSDDNNSFLYHELYEITADDYEKIIKYNSKAKQYYNFDHWTNCILAYKNMIEYRHKDGEDYYHFLLRIQYAEDSMYINKVKSIVSKLPP